MRLLHADIQTESDIIKPLSNLRRYSAYGYSKRRVGERETRQKSHLGTERACSKANQDVLVAA
mgnify:CR=1 FL=1